MNRLWKAFKYSSAGLISCFKNEPAFRLECYTLFIAIPLAFLIGSAPMEYILLIGSIGLVMVVELLNSAIENVNDRIGKEYHDLCKMAKDQSSAAVFVSILLAIVVWGVIVINDFL
jgi:diacylglycerol kinase (ATP)